MLKNINFKKMENSTIKVDYVWYCDDDMNMMNILNSKIYQI